MVSRSAILACSDLFGELLEQIGVCARVDLTSEELARGADGDTRHLAPQAFLGARGIELDLLLRGGDDAGAFAARGAARLFDQLVGALLGVLDDLVGALARLADDAVRLVPRLGKLLLAFLGGRQPLCDLALALIHCTQNRWPEPLHRGPDERREYDHLHDEREID